MPINVTRSSMPGFDEYCEEIRELWDSHFLTNMGVKHQQLEKDLEKYLDVAKLIFNETSLYLRVQLKQSFQFEKLTESLKEESVRLMPYQSENEIGLSFSGIGIEKIQDGIKIIAKAIGKAK